MIAPASAGPLTMSDGAAALRLPAASALRPSASSGPSQASTVSLGVGVVCRRTGCAVYCGQGTAIAATVPTTAAAAMAAPAIRRALVAA
ncbi:hypothetical protein [Microbacterium sp. 22296]|uniref:hypothetical protein n=1 Tax=Microbacterium sp. 22296 TaxID=3453903 RepID=UPI003F847B11